MWALLGRLVSLALGWKWEGLSAALTLLFFIADEIALLIYGIRTIGLPAGLAMPLSAISFPFILFQMGGIFLSHQLGVEKICKSRITPRRFTCKKEL